MFTTNKTQIYRPTSKVSNQAQKKFIQKKIKNKKTAQTIKKLARIAKGKQEISETQYGAGKKKTYRGSRGRSRNLALENSGRHIVASKH